MLAQDVLHLCQNSSGDYPEAGRQLQLSKLIFKPTCNSTILIFIKKNVENNSGTTTFSVKCSN